MDPVIQVTTGDSVELNCQVLLGNPKPKVNWLYEGQAITTDEFTTKSGDGNVNIDDVQAFHGGDYLCLASNVGGNASFLVRVEVQVPPIFGFDSPEDNVTDFRINQGDTVVLPCNVQGDPTPLITWFKDESPISLTDYHYYIREDGSLEIFSAEATDTGEYRCQATNIAGDIEKVVDLFVQVKPTIAGEPNERLTVTENETVVLPCVGSGVPTPEITWRKNFVPFNPTSEKYLFGDYGLTILNSKIEDKAIYECIVTNVAGSETKVITLVVQIPPVILDKGASEITVIKGDDVTLLCENFGNPVPTVDWKKDETVLTVFDEVSGFTESENGSLLIESVRVDHSGRYVCVVENNAGIATRDFTLNVLDPPKLPSNLTKYKEIIEGSPVVIRCPASGTPQPLITWYKDGLLITGDHGGLAILDDGSLEILDAEAEDSSVYTCIAENQAGEVEHDVEVKVIVKPKLTGKDQGQDGVVDDKNVIIGNNITLVCPVEGDPQPTITWLQNGYALQRSELGTVYEISSDGMNLTVYSADVDDTARYTCIAENIGGEVEKSFDLNVHVPPNIDPDSVSPDVNIINKDSSLYIDCPVTGIPRPNVLWYKDGDLLSPENDPNLHVHADGRRLEIVGAQVSDSGKYKCVGENVAGRTEQEFDVDVHVGPVIERPGEIEKPEIISNESISLTCPASGIPLPRITWYKNNQIISANTSRITLLDDGWTLRITSVNVEDSARYTCRAQNEAGDGEKVFDLDVLVPPMIQRENLNLDPKVVLNQSLIINCLVEGKPSPTIIWYKNGIQLDASVQPRYEILSSGRQLRVKQAQVSDTATFQCLAENKAGTDSVDFNLKVLVPATIDFRRYNKNPKVVVNGNLTVLCRVTGVPVPTISWFKDGEDLDVDSLDNVEVDNEGQELTIYSAQVGDTALYTCRAVNEAGESDISYQVDVQVPPTIDGDEVDNNPHVVLGNSIVLNCPAKGVPTPNIIWMKGGQPIDLSTNSHLTVEADGQRLVIERSKLTDSDVFTCIAANQAGSLEQDYDLDVWVPPAIDSSDLNLNPKVNKGHSSVLFCPVEGNPVPDILWLKDGDPIQLDDRVQIVQDGIELRILNSKESDTGRYTCVARNPAGQQSLSYDLEIHVPPSIDESNVVYFRKVVENRTIIIECPVSGIPKPKVSWLINNSPATPREGLQFTHNNYHLELASAQVTDTAIYTCVATNEAGELRKKFDLEVQVPPKIDYSKLEKERDVIQNRSQVIICPVNGIPVPSIIWYKDGVPLLDWPYDDLSLTNGDLSLEVLNAQTDDAGVYTCQATNPAGQVKFDITLHVYVPPHIVDSEIVSHVSHTEGENIALECIASGLPEPQLAWIKDDKTIEILENPHITIQKNGRLLQIAKSEVSDAGKYICHAENLVGIAERMFELEVNVPPIINGTFDRLNNVWVVINDPLTLECPATGVPPPVITWKRQEQFIQQYGSPGIRLLDNGRKLYIVSAQLTDLGDYSCYVENVAGNTSLDYFVNVYVPPTIERGLERVEAVVNTGATLFCESLGLPDPVVTWEKDGKPFPTTGLRHRMRVSGTIEFTSVRLEDTGTYTCNATNKAGTAARVIKLDVQVPPRMVGRQPLYLNTAEGRSIVLPCDVTGTPVPTITWQKGAKVVRGGPGIEVIENGSLLVQNTKEEDAGVYLCIAQNDAGAAFGQIILRINLPPNVYVRETDFVINKGQKIVLPCIANGRPRPKITWEKDGVPVRRSNAYIRLTRTGLAITFAREEDVGTYTCIATNDAGTSRVDLKLLVQEPPTIEEASRLLTFTLGEIADIDCAATGIPPPKIRWFKDGREISVPSSKYDITDAGKLIIKELTEDDHGSYLCTAINVAGQATQERLVRIQVPPSFIVVPQIKEVTLNSRLELRCTANGKPTPTIHWKRNEVPVRYQPSVNGRSVFIVHNVRREDAGVYTCLAQNPAGQAEVNTMVTVKVPPEILASPGNRAVTIAERVILTCSVGGDPPPEVIWMKNERPVRLSDRIKQLKNGSLVIFDSTSSDAGEYKCVATNDAGISEGVAMLTVREPPSFLLEPQHTRVIHGETILVDCLGSGEPTPKMDWMIGWDILQDQGRLSILPNNTLRILLAQLSDSGSYRCLASNNLGQSFVEINITVVVHGDWSDWSDWASCSATCGEGRQLRHRLCDNPEPANYGDDCRGIPVESRTCQIRPCPVPGNWGHWSPWDPCSVTCNEGTRLRRRLCDNPAPQAGGANCDGEAVEIKSCNKRGCAVDGGWGSWASWQACTVTCGEGLQERIRRCDNPPPSDHGGYCLGDEDETQRCKLRECPVDGNWGNWGHWNPCTLSCGGGTRTRSRACNYPEPLYGGLYCIGTDLQLDYCNSEPCPVHGGWADWGLFGECSVSCGGGLKKRFRTCSNPSPSNNGHPCRGQADDTVPCNRDPCPIDGEWSVWSDWSMCSRTCDRGTKYRQRRCQQPRHGGATCRGDNKQIMDCYQEPCYAIPVEAEGNMIGYINNIDIPAATFTVQMTPLPDKTATRINATIRGVPKLLVPHFRHLLSVLSPVYWSTAQEIDGAYNGYTLTDGQFTREAQIQYATGEILKMSHYSKGVDSDGKLQLDIVVSGNVPDISPSQNVRISPYWEQYTQSGPGSVQTQSRRLLHVDGHMLPHASNHSIVYNKLDNKMPFLVQRMHASNLYVDVFPNRELVNYILDTSISPGSPSNQCPEGYILHEEGSYCQDIDECTSTGPCSDYCHNSIFLVL
ncbi:hemicentin-1-like isoform X2 [Ruditapes philippinarum]|uniref:hemicentin-1-like isoform X2 n=1 Tax=Ruditapes philippinarum TaxID=129788 RepID=UPI00295A5B31|nr:hemicentin-1-like isoform X2 [Ruditapes philippinarum]